jgi:hypothetical protein
MKPTRSLKLAKHSSNKDDCSGIDNGCDVIVDVDADETENARATDVGAPLLDSEPVSAPSKAPLSIKKRRSVGSEEPQRTSIKKSPSIPSESESTPARPVNTMTRYFSPTLPTPRSVQSQLSTPFTPVSSPSPRVSPPPTPNHLVDLSASAEWHVVMDSARPVPPLESCDDVLKLVNESPLSAYAFHVRHLVYQVAFERADTRHLFNAEESTVFRRVLSLSSGSLGVFARLLSRKGEGMLGGVLENSLCVCSLGNAVRRPVVPSRVLSRLHI